MSADPIAAHAGQVIAKGSKSFTRAAQLLPGDIRAGAHQLYAWCRYCDDLIDDQIFGHAKPGGSASPGPSAQEHLAQLRGRTTAVLAGGTDPEPVFQGLARIVRQYQIPTHHPHELLDGMAMDVEGRRYQTLDALAVYCYHVAGVVGVMMAHIMGIKDEATLQRAEDLGIAMQLTNIARDVRDDAKVGRVYLPLDWLEEAGIAPDATGVPSPALAGVVAQLLDEADRRYASGDHGISHLPFRYAWSIAAARHIYADIGRVIRARGVNAWAERAYVPGWRKTVLILKALLATAR